MYINILGFLLGNFSLLIYKSVPSLTEQIIFVAFLFLLSLFLSKKYRYFLWVIACGFLWTVLYLVLTLNPSIPQAWEKKSVLISGAIISPIKSDKHIQSFIFHVKKICYKNQCKKLGFNISLNNYGQFFLLTPGERWQFVTVLKKTRNLGNPGGFDFISWSLEQGIVRFGNIKKSPLNKQLKPSGYHQWINQWRDNINKKIYEYSDHKELASFISALVVGMRTDISKDQWQVLRNTGTNHLFAISGLHVSLLAGLALLLFKYCWRLFPKACLWLAAPRAASVFALMITWFYSALAGFSVSTQRACIMLSIFLLGLFFNKPLTGMQGFMLALLLVTLCNPLSALSVSFWLSFGAVAIIFVALMNQEEKPWKSWCRIQSFLFLGLAPLTLLFFNQVSLVSVVANMIAIPWISWCIVPLSLVSVGCMFIYANLGKMLLHCTEMLFQGLWFCLSHLAALHHVLFRSFEHPGYAWLGLFVAMGLCLLPRGFPGKSCAIFLALPWLLLKTPNPPDNTLWLTVLDVGQGLSIVIQTHHHVLVYDTGPRYYSGSDAGERILLPYFHSQGIHHIDRLVISHIDSDHSGGALSLLNGIPVDSLYTSALDLFPSWHPKACEEGESWECDGAQFQWLSPKSLNKTLSTNSQSCVLLIRYGDHKILLPGDIEKNEEDYLLTNEADSIKNIDILMAPHHGSITSSTPDFVAQTRPKYGVFATGFDNIFGFPDKKVVFRYKESGALLYDTATDGSIRFIVAKNKPIEKPQSYNVEHPMPWQFKKNP